MSYTTSNWCLYKEIYSFDLARRSHTSRSCVLSNQRRSPVFDSTELYFTAHSHSLPPKFFTKFFTIRNRRLSSRCYRIVLPHGLHGDKRETPPCYRERSARMRTGYIDNAQVCESDKLRQEADNRTRRLKLRLKILLYARYESFRALRSRFFDYRSKDNEIYIYISVYKQPLSFPEFLGDKKTEPALASSRLLPRIFANALVPRIFTRMFLCSRNREFSRGFSHFYEMRENNCSICLNIYIQRTRNTDKRI